MKRENLNRAYELSQKIEHLKGRIKKTRRMSEKKSNFNLYAVEENELLFTITNEELNLIIQCREREIAELEKELEGIL